MANLLGSTVRLAEIRGFIGGFYGADLHSKRTQALACATLGVMTGASLAVSLIGQALAQARGLVTRHAVKPVDRLMSNAGIDVWDSFARWVPPQMAERRDCLVPTIAERRVMIRPGDESDSPREGDHPDHGGARGARSGGEFAQE